MPTRRGSGTAAHPEAGDPAGERGRGAAGRHKEEKLPEPLPGRPRCPAARPGTPPHTHLAEELLLPPHLGLLLLLRGPPGTCGRGPGHLRRRGAAPARPPPRAPHVPAVARSARPRSSEPRGPASGGGACGRRGPADVTRWMRTLRARREGASGWPGGPGAAGPGPGVGAHRRRRLRTGSRDR